MSEDTRVPEVTATVSSTAAVLVIGSERRQLNGSSVEAVREAVRHEVAELSAELGEPVPFTAEENGARYRLIVHPDGSVVADGVVSAANPPAPAASSTPASTPAPTPAPTPPPVPGNGFGQPASRPAASPVYGPAGGYPTSIPTSVPTSVPASGPTGTAGGEPPQSAAFPPPGQGDRHGADLSADPAAEPSADRGSSQDADLGRRSWPPMGYPASGPSSADRPDDPDAEPQPRHAVSFLPPERPVELPALPPEQRGFFARMFGKNNEPDPALVAAQRAEAADQALVSKHWPGPKTIAVVNGKGGSGKTPTTAFLSAVFARYGGGGVIAWDNNDTRGTLGWRTASGGHDKTVLDLIPAAEALMDRNAQIGRLAAFVHHQPEDKYDVLRSNPELLAQDQRLSTEQFRALHAVANRFYRMIFMDSGNDESTYAWLNMIEAADQIVVPTTTRPDHAEAGVLLLDALRRRNADCRALAERAVVIVSQADQDEAAADTIAAGFRQLLPAENVVTIPYDRAIRDSQLRYDRLAPGTQRAFLRAAAAVAGQL